MSKTLLATVVILTLLLTPSAFAAAPGITGPTFNLTAKQAFLSQPDGSFVYSWGYGCNGAPAGYAPEGITTRFCNTMQVPGPTLIVTQGQTVTVNLTNNLPNAAGNTSILFPGFTVTASGGVAGLLTQEAAPSGGTVTYTFTASTPGTRAYYSGTQGDLQVEMGLYGAIIVLPSSGNIPGSCTGGVHSSNAQAQAHWGESDFRLAAAAYNHPGACYDREYLFQFSEIDPRIHRQAEEQATRTCTGCMNVATEPYVPAFFMVNGRSMPDLMDPNYAPEYPHQPYNGNPHMHPGELVLLRIIGQGRWQHPFHEHGNHVRILARDGNLLLSATDATSLAGPLLFTTTTTPGQAMDGIYYWTGKGLNWDAYGHNPASGDPLAKLPCTPDTNGYNTGGSAYQQINYFEWCQDHNKPLQVTPIGDVAGGGPATLPDPNIFANGAWFGGSPYLGPNATVRSVGSTGTTPPSGTVANSPTDEAGFAFMWHSHNEREITTNNIFPGGMMMMMLVDSREFVINEQN
ncbi:MAG TPA: multicopper oxidase domain-containing protein [Terriglobales bacterium]|nr:multicopper oxidase domain-containing protein [Terriglobales bacterium]